MNGLSKGNTIHDLYFNHYAYSLGEVTIIVWWALS